MEDKALLTAREVAADARSLGTNGSKRTVKLLVRSLHAVKCGPLQDVKIGFASKGTNPVTVLAGANGSGKTTVLEIVTALFDIIAHFSFMFSTPSEYWTYRGYSPEQFVATERILRRISFAEMEVDINGHSLIIAYSATDPGLENNPNRLLIFRQEDGRLGHHASVHSNLLLDLDYDIANAEKKAFMFTFSDKRKPSTEVQHLPSILFFPAYRVVTANRGEEIRREETKYQWVYRYENTDDFRSSIDSFLIWLDYASPDEYLRAVRFLDSLDIGGKKFSVLRTELKGLVTTRDGHQHFLEYLSSGEQHLIVALLQLARRLTPHSIVLIDEMENALHPAYQHLFAELLMRMQSIVPFQLLVTTHAPAIVDAFGPQSVRLLTAQ